ncbi:TetR family transcriptional regulator protein [Tolypothrix sp. NIES-4075]|uniref:TetR/AcrR family transcriptional regulator n=1 Tax=Tolypothrix sp. NIES-4075 TaxID=2005459 RepID=UPI000B5C670F|nr:TetR/AcrR family transcriptional regulator [Tolypothrix sp. NIES-4075]GAX42262.1 TetR family transcriptional regulator protein [Tolypothrix sp. NIES-4075]
MPKTRVKAKPDEAKPALREHILDIADELFYREGIRATGVDTIVAKSGVAKTTLYRYFPSKDDLVVAYLERRNQRFWELMSAEIAKHPNQPGEQLLAVFKWLDELLAKPDCLGCPFLVTTSEFAELDYPGHQVSIKHKEAVRSRLIELAQEAGASKERELGANLLLLLDGAFAQRRLFGTVAEVSLEKAAATLINAYLPT